jgi:hypothetical protein
MKYCKSHFEGRITRPIYRGILTDKFIYKFPSLNGNEAIATFSSMNEHDLTVLSKLAFEENIPVLLNPSQHYRFMGQFIEMVEKELPLVEIILMRLVEAALVRMAPAMFKKKVFICQDISPEIEDLKRLRKCFIAFQDYIKIHSFVAGNNTIYVDLYSSEECAGGFNAIRRGIIELGTDELVPPVIEDISDGRNQQHGA